MYFGLVHYPHIKHEGFQSFRKTYDPYSDLLPEHITFIHPVPGELGREKLERHIEHILNHWHPFDVHFCTVEKSWDHWMYLGAKEGHQSVIDLHDQLYDGMLSPYLRKDLPFYPHIGLGLFSKEAYNFDNPTARLTLNKKKYDQAKGEFEDLCFDLWCAIDQLTLLSINADYTVCNDLRTYNLHSHDHQRTANEE